MLSSNSSLQVDTETRLSACPTRSDHLRPWLPLIRSYGLSNAHHEDGKPIKRFGHLLAHCNEGIPTFIDSRAELYGPILLNRYVRAISLDDPADFVRLLDEYKIDATLLFPSTQAVGLLDRLPEWERTYADDMAVVHLRRTHPGNADYLN